jgi:hypothetical protein
VCAAIVVSAAAARLDAEGVGLAVRAGSTGLGAEVTVGLAGPLSLRVGGSWLELNREFTRSGITFDGRARVAFGTAILDLRPGRGAFRISVGAFYNGTRAVGDSVGGTIVLDGVPYDTRLVGTVHGEARGRDLAPYAGIGWGDALRGRSRIGFVADVGVVYWGRPNVSLVAVPANPALVPPGFYDDLEVERKKIEDDVSKYRFFPVVSLGLAFRF